MSEQEIIKILTEQFGGNLWENYGKRRVYFDGVDIARRQGLDWGTYNSGNISSARLNGEKISNSECKRILRAFHTYNFKLWYDLNEEGFSRKGDMNNHATAIEMKDQFLADAKAAIA